MKFLIVLCIAITAVTYAEDGIKIPEASRSKFLSHVEECLEEQKLTLDAVAGINKGDFSNSAPEVQCFAKCFLQKFGFFVDGVVKEDVVVELLTPILGEEKLKNVMESCHSLKGANDCETAFKLYECYYGQHSKTT